MSARRLHVAKDFSLPLDAVTQTFWFLGKRGSGKTHNATVLVEEMLKAAQQVIVIDPMTAWYGLRSSVDGKSPGLPIGIFGGPHGDLPLEPGAGTYMADLAIAERVSMILDIKRWTKADRQRFVTAFFERMLNRNTEPVHLVIEEAELTMPQRPMTDDSKSMLGIAVDVVRLGRGSGIGSSLVSQRSADVNKGGSSQTEVLVAHRTPGKHDRDAVKGWFEVHDLELLAEAMAVLPTLPTGTALVSATDPDFLDFFGQVRFRARETFDSSATPKVGQARREARTFADIDLAAVKEAMADTIERFKAEDPKELRLEVARLRKQLATANAARPAPEPVVETAEVPVLDEQLVARLETVFAGVSDLGRQFVDESTELAGKLTAAAMSADARRAQPEPRPASVRPRPTTERVTQPPTSTPGTESPDTKLGKGERKVLSVLAQFPEGRANNELAFLAGYSMKASTLGVILARLRRWGLVTPSGVPQITAEGLAAIGTVEPMPTGPALLEHWRQHKRIGEGGRRVIDVLVEQYPNELSHEELCEMAGYSPEASTMGVILGKLRKLGIVEKGVRRLTAEFWESIQ